MQALRVRPLTELAAVKVVDPNAAPEPLGEAIALARHKAGLTACHAELFNRTYHGADLRHVLKLIQEGYNPIESKGGDDLESWPDEVPWTIDDYIVMHYQNLRERSAEKRQKYLHWMVEKAHMFAFGGWFESWFLENVISQAAIHHAFIARDSVDVILALARIPLYLHRAIGI